MCMPKNVRWEKYDCGGREAAKSVTRTEQDSVLEDYNKPVSADVYRCILAFVYDI